MSFKMFKRTNSDAVAMDGKAVTASDSKVFTSKEAIAELALKQNDIYIGKDSAKINIVIYSSFSCYHCAFFYKNTFPELKPYIDSGQVRLVHRDFPTDKLAIDVAQLFSCYKEQANVQRQKLFNVLLSIYLTQDSWIKQDLSNDVILKQFKLMGLSNADSCLKIDSKNDYKQKNIAKARNVANILGIVATPTIFVNNTKNTDKNSPYNIKILIERELEGLK